LESLNNVADCSGASSAEMRLAKENGDLTFDMSDDGAGFDADRTSYGWVLRRMADRVEAIGGTLEILSTPGSGTSVRISRARLPA
jgi:signal transduction histidine kinase